MKKYIIYFGILTAGLALGWLFFGNSSTSEEKNQQHESLAIENELWTCSMHPQIMQPQSGDCPICGMDLIPSEVSADGLTANEFKMSNNALALANIETSIVALNSTSENSIILSGKITENEHSTVVQTAHFGGRIEKLAISTTGENVHKGQLLASIYSPELVTAQKELLIALANKKTDPLLYTSVKNKLKLWKLSEQQINQIETSKKIVTNFPIYTNVNGIVSKKMVEEGSYVKEGQGLLMITNLNTVWAEFDAYEKQLPLLNEGDNISITTNTNTNEEIKATISFIDPVLNTSTRTVIVRAALNNRKNKLKPGMFIEGKITLKKHKNMLLTIPKTAVLWTGKRSIVYVKKKSDTPIFELRNVTLGNEIDNAYEILNGLTENEEIVTNGTFTVDAAAQLQGKKSMMNSIEGKVMTGHENHSTMKQEISKNTNELSFGVRGNCSMCKATIEKAATSIPGVFSANWSVEKKKIDVVFNTSKTTELEIHKAIANSGYDTEKVKGNTAAYENLPTCCLYSREMKMNQ